MRWKSTLKCIANEPSNAAQINFKCVATVNKCIAIALILFERKITPYIVMVIAIMVGAICGGLKEMISALGKQYDGQLVYNIEIYVRTSSKSQIRNLICFYVYW